MLWKIQIYNCLNRSYFLKPRFTIRTIVLSYKILNEKPSDPNLPPVLILHDLLSSKKAWQKTGKIYGSLTERNTIIVDIRNHGNSPQTNTHTYEDMAEDILKLYNKLDIKSACLVGHGMGGRACMYLALTSPQKVSDLLVIDISPVSTPKQFTEFFPTVMKEMKSIDLSGFTSLYKARKAAAISLRKVISNESVIRNITENINKQGGLGITWTCNLDVLMKYFSTLAIFPESAVSKVYHGPTLFIGGQLSEYIPPDDLPRIRELFTSAVIVYVPKTDHNLQDEDLRSFIEHSIAFLKSS